MRLHCYLSRNSRISKVKHGIVMAHDVLERFLHFSKQMCHSKQMWFCCGTSLLSTTDFLTCYEFGVHLRPSATNVVFCCGTSLLSTTDFLTCYEFGVHLRPSATKKRPWIDKAQLLVLLLIKAQFHSWYLAHDYYDKYQSNDSHFLMEHQYLTSICQK